MMQEWVNLLKESLATENQNRPSVMILATLSRNGSPRARSIVCRAIDDDGTIWFVSDSRSKKNAQIRNDRRVEVVFWLPALRRQLRIRGEVRVIDANAPRRIELWKSLSDETRAMFTWPAPGEDRVDRDNAFAKSLPSDAGPASTFEAIAIHPRLVEQLDLDDHPHARRQWRRKNAWRAERINP
jgi:PPOX class probable FMN-dependent enzyme